MQSVVSLAKVAGQGIMSVYQGNITTRLKDDESPVTEADLAAHNIILAGLEQLSPGVPIISEESDAIPFQLRRKWNRYWLVDPLDGTREFIKRNGEFTVNIALIEHHNPVLGVVYAPALDLLYFAVKGEGAYRQQGSLLPHAIKSRQIPERITVAGSRSHTSGRMQEFLRRIGPHELISMGSSLKICLVAEGRADVYPRLGPTSEWDTAAGQCVLEEAGGQLVGMDGRSFRYNTRESLLNSEFFATGSKSRNWDDYIK